MVHVSPVFSQVEEDKSRLVGCLWERTFKDEGKGHGGVIDKAMMGICSRASGTCVGREEPCGTQLSSAVRG